MCGCNFDGKKCTNVYPDCPALTDQGQNFGAGFYNDHHFHFGYHIYAAAGTIAPLLFSFIYLLLYCFIVLL